MQKFAALLVILISVALLACSGESLDVDAREESLEHQSSKAQSADFDSAGPRGPAGAASPAAEASVGMPFRGEAAAAAPQAPPAPFEGGDDGSIRNANALQTAQRMVISTASISIEVETVDASVDQVRGIAEDLGGFVEQLSSSGGAEEEQANITLRVPQVKFFSALERIEKLGEVQNRNVGSEDVSEEFIDLEARLKSSQSEETSLLALLERANNVTEILTIERELTRVRSEIERAQGRLNFLERRVALATIHVFLFPPGTNAPEPPSASLVIETTDVFEHVEQVKAQVTSLNGELDRVFLTTEQGRDRAELVLRVFNADFDAATQFIEDQGEVRRKELREGTDLEGAEPAKKPDARIVLTLVEEESSKVWIVWTFLIIFGLTLLTAAGGAGWYLTYRAGRRRGSFV